MGLKEKMREKKIRPSNNFIFIVIIRHSTLLEHGIVIDSMRFFSFSKILPNKIEQNQTVRFFVLNIFG